MNNLECGALMGAAIGDMVSKKLQFLGRPATSQEVAIAISFAKRHISDFRYDHPDHQCGGCENIHFGWVSPLITQLGCLTLALGMTLRNNNWQYDKKKVDSVYHDWVLEAAERGDLGKVGDVLDAIAAGYSAYNQKAVDGMALARATPLAIMGARMAPSHDFSRWFHDRKPFWDVLRTDTAITHSNPICMASSHLYVNIVRLLLLGQANDYTIEAFLRGRSDPDINQMGVVMQWIYDALFDGFKPTITPGDGHVRIPLQLAFYHLGQRTPFWDGIRDVASLGGDVTVNVTATAGLLGAMDGFQLIKSVN